MSTASPTTAAPTTAAPTQQFGPWTTNTTSDCTDPFAYTFLLGMVVFIWIVARYCQPVRLLSNLLVANERKLKWTEK